MINDEKEVSALRKQIIGLTACLAGLCFSGCRDVVLSTSLNDHILFSGTKTRHVIIFIMKIWEKPIFGRKKQERLIFPIICVMAE